MRHSDSLARYDALTDALRVATEAIGDVQPSRQALGIVNAIKRLRDQQPARIAKLERIDYLEKAQSLARAVWLAAWRDDAISFEQSARGSAETPLGTLTVTTSRRQWRGGRRVWFSEYTLNGNPITVREIKAAGLAQRPTSRNRQKG